MDSTSLLFMSAGLLFLMVLNSLLSREVCHWIPQASEKVWLLLLIWLLPVIGILLVYRRVRPGWFGPEHQGDNSGSPVSSGLLALDAIFNPGSAHVLDARKRSEVTIRMEGEMYDRELPEHIEIEPRDEDVSKKPSCND